MEKSSKIKERKHTIRDDIFELLKDNSYSLIEISRIIKISEKSIVEHLEHLKRSLSNKGYSLKVYPAKCLSCGFIFTKRDRLKKPGRCPICKSEHIQDPLFKIENVK